MNAIQSVKLDNPVWHSLNESHSGSAIGYGSLKCYQPYYCVFGGYDDPTNIAEQIAQYARITNNFYIVGDKPAFPQHVSLVRELVCQQMIISSKIDYAISEDIVQLNGLHEAELFDLATLVQPGYFMRRTSSLGNYYGIFKNNVLVAAAGERLKMNDCTEISAIVTHPNHTGKGYAKQLTAFVSNKIWDESKLPYLHVAATNTVAISLYDKLGFTARRKISFWQFTNAKRE